MADEMTDQAILTAINRNRYTYNQSQMHAADITCLCERDLDGGLPLQIIQVHDAGGSLYAVEFDEYNTDAVVAYKLTTSTNQILAKDETIAELVQLLKDATVIMRGENNWHDATEPGLSIAAAIAKATP